MKNISRRTLFLLLLDLTAIAAANALGFYFETGTLNYPAARFSFLYLSFVVFPLLFYIFDLYYPFKLFVPSHTFVDVALGVAVGMVILGTASYFDRTFFFPRFYFIYTTLSLAPLIFAIRIFYDFIFRSRFLDKRALVLGTGPLALEIARVIKETTHSGMEVVGLVAEDKKSNGGRKNGVPVLGGFANLLSLIDWYGIQLVVLALDPEEAISETKVMTDLLKRRVMVTSAIHLFEKLTGNVPHRLLGSHYLLGLAAQVRTRAYLKLKRIVDLIFSGVLLIALSPLFLMTMGILAISGPGKIFFIQERIGRDDIPFRLIKFRSMAERKKGKPVITWFGKWIRRYRIDEIPQLINVLKGDMSLVGPRPEIPYFTVKSRARIPFYDVVFAVKPGLTGWAQVMFRYTTSMKDYDEKFRYNLYYLKNISLALDLVIILKTIRVVLLGRGK